MISDFEQFDCGELESDVVVVGAGAVGLAVAICLYRAGKSVVLLEAGGESVEERSQAFLRNAISTGRPFAGLETGRFSSLGGTTTAWGGQLVPFDPIVFEHRPWVSSAKWPISADSLAYYYQEAAALINAKDPLVPSASLWSKLGIPIVDWSEEIEPLLTQWLRQPNFGTLFFPELSAKAGPRIVLHARVTEIDASPDGTINSLAFVNQAGKVGLASASCFVLATGTVETIRLLKTRLSRGRFATWSENNLLGSYFTDHIDAFVGRVRPLDKARFHDVFDSAILDNVKYFPRLKLSALSQRTNHMVGVAGHMIFDSLLEDHLQNFKAFAKAILHGRWPKDAMSAPFHVWQLGRVMFPLVTRYVRSNRILSLSDRGIRLRLTCEQIPIRESCVTIGDRLDANGIPLVQLNWALDGRELESMAFLAKAIRNQLWKQGLAEVEIDDRLAKGEATFLDTADDAYHQMGGVRMGFTPEEGVVDANLRVHGSTNLYVAGAATFPTTGFENPTLTAISLGIRLGEHLTRSVL
ncbi:FAD-dependent oxidoreductase [Methylocystis echinoides]|uniref:FAD-dependent oxidoreductase n=1 Tax=Methylocystis echinoides TaxID=29468 RepID=UPI00342F98C5